MTDAGNDSINRQPERHYPTCLSRHEVGVARRAWPATRTEGGPNPTDRTRHQNDTHCYRLPVIPDIALMIVVYGSARLLTALLEPYRRGTGTGAQVATGVSWIVAAIAIAGLGFLGLAVLSSANSLPDLTK
jgi:hypothetical protein